MAAVSTRGDVLSGVVGAGEGRGPVSKARDSATASWNPPFRTALQRSIGPQPFAEPEKQRNRLSLA